MEVRINKEVRSYTEAIFFGLNARQFIFSVIACIAALITYFVTGKFFNTEIVSWLCITAALPFGALGFITFQQMKTEDILKPAIETQLEYEFKQPIQLEELVKHGMRTKRKAVMKEDGLRSELFRFLEEYEAEDRKFDDNFNPDQDPDVDYQMFPGEERETTVSERIHQKEFRQGLLKKYSHCCLCSVENRELLYASHIKPWDKSTSEEKTNLNNGLLLCPNHDKLFDKGFISFDSYGKILVSEDLSDVDRTFMNVNPNFTLEMNDEMKEFMEYHRDNIFKK